MTTLREILKADPSALGYNAPSLADWLGDEDDVPGPGESTSLGWGGISTRSDSGTIRPSDLEDEGGARFVVFSRVTGWGDYAGSDYDRSNCRSLARDFPEIFVHVTGGYGYEVLAIDLDLELPEDTDLAGEVYVLRILRELADDYPIYDESDHSELQMELEQEDWESFGRDEVRRFYLVEAVQRELDDQVGEGGLDPDDLVESITDDDLDAEWSEIRQNGDGGEWEPETAVNGYFRKDALQDVADRLARRVVEEELGKILGNLPRHPVGEGQLSIDA